MKHLAKRLKEYADDHKIIHIEEVRDIALRKLARDKSINGKIRDSLHAIDHQLELLIPYQVDDHEKQLKRYIQYHMGLVVNLSELKRKHKTYYKKLCEYGTPRDVIKEWGLDYTFNRNLTIDKIKEELEIIADGNTIRRLYTDHKKLYWAVSHQASVEGCSVKEYLLKLGFSYDDKG